MANDSRVSRSRTPSCKPGFLPSVGIIAQLASALNVVDLEPAQGAASLAAPAISCEDFLV